MCGHDQPRSWDALRCCLKCCQGFCGRAGRLLPRCSSRLVWMLVGAEDRSLRRVYIPSSSSRRRRSATLASGRAKPHAVFPPHEKVILCRHMGCEVKFGHGNSRWKHEVNFCKYRPPGFRGWRVKGAEQSEDEDEDIEGEDIEDDDEHLEDDDENLENDDENLGHNHASTDPTDAHSDSQDPDDNNTTPARVDDEQTRRSASDGNSDVMIEDSTIQEGP